MAPYETPTHAVLEELEGFEFLQAGRWIVGALEGDPVFALRGKVEGLPSTPGWVELGIDSKFHKPVSPARISSHEREDGGIRYRYVHDRGRFLEGSYFRTDLVEALGALGELHLAPRSDGYFDLIVMRDGEPVAVVAPAAPQG